MNAFEMLDRLEARDTTDAARRLRQRSVAELKVLARHYRATHCVNWRKNELVEELAREVVCNDDLPRLEDRHG